MKYQQILISTEHAVRTITLSRPEKLNAWTPVMEQEVRDALESASADRAIRAIVVTGAGRGFCAGADMGLVNAIATGTSERRVEEPVFSASSRTLDTNYERRFSYMLRLPKPVIAAINGPVAGIGLCFTLFCDFRYMAQGAKVTTAFARRGLVAEHGSSWILPRLIGPMHALDLLLSARTVLTDEAAAMGLIKPLPAENFLVNVQRIATELVHTSSPRSIRIMKRQIYDGLFQSLDQAWHQADVEMVESFKSEDFREGVAHFLEKRAPAFTGN